MPNVESTSSESGTTLVPLKQKYLPENGYTTTKCISWPKRGLRGANHGSNNAGKPRPSKKRGSPQPWTKAGHNGRS